MTIKMKPVAAAVALTLAAGPVWAVQDFYLATKAYDKALPDGTSVPMWGYVLDEDNNGNNVGDCYETTPASARQACIDGLTSVPTMPGPQLVVPPGEQNVRIFLSNGLPEPTSIIIPGQEMPWSNVNSNGPTWDGGGSGDANTGPRTSPGQRVRSFGREAAANGGARPYVWNNFRETSFTGPGTFMYHSGTHPQKQVYMGLSGLITQDSAAGEIYPGVTYDNEATLFYSDIDPIFNQAVVDGTLTTAATRHPTWFLVNGEPYTPSVTPDIDAGVAGTNTLLRLASTALDTHVVVLQGLDMTLHAEDGQQYSWQELGVGGAKHPAPRVQYSAMLPPEKTKDAIITGPEGRFAVYDGNGYMSNPSDPTNESVGDSAGGMIRFLAFTAAAPVNTAPVANGDSYDATVDTPLVIAAPGVLGNDTDAESNALTATTTGTTNPTPANGTLTLGSDGSFTYTPTAGYTGPDSFTYVANDGALDSNEATVSINVNPPSNTAPVADAQAVSLDEDTPTGITLTGSDANGDTLTYAVATGPANGTLSGAAPNLTYTPNTNFNGADSFTFTVNDGTVDSGSATVSITVIPVNDAPVADAQSVTTDQDVPLPITLSASDVDGDPLTYAVVTQPVNGVLNGTAPNLSYVPNAGTTGADSFTFTVNDGTVDSAAATVDITVNATGAAAGSMVFSTSGAGAVPGVAGPYDDADLYSVAIANPEANNVYARVSDAVNSLGLPNNANIDGLSIDGSNIYVSFAAASTSVPGVGSVQDEDVVVYNGSSWSLFFNGALCGLNASNGMDIDAVQVEGTAPNRVLYFSTAGGGGANTPTGVTGPAGDDADIYTWNEGATSCGRAVDVTAAWGLPGNADIDGLTVVGSTYYISFRRSGGTSVTGLGTVQDESVVSYDGSTWSWAFVGTGQLDGSNSQNVDALQFQP